ncbi:MAG: hypothetical protein L0K50_07235, partial [Lacticaseibacillus paracasei]|nr:hypothetical protein [Lacticaseibacillus paracasei]
LSDPEMVEAGNDRKDTSEVNKFRNATVMAKKKTRWYRVRTLRAIEGCIFLERKRTRLETGV